MAFSPQMQHARSERLADGIGAVVFAIFIGAAVFFLIIPTLIVFPMSIGTSNYLEFPPKGFTLSWFSDYFNDRGWMRATWFSLRIALTTTFTATLIGTMTAIAMVRGAIPGKDLINALTLSPMIIPQIVIAVAIYLVFAPLHLTGNFFGFLIAHTVLAVPYVVLTVSASMQRFDPLLEKAALSCGANRLQTFWYVVVPGIMPGIIAGAVFAFMTSFDEATVAFFISGLDGTTITRKMFEDIDTNLTPLIAAVSVVMVLVSIGLMSVAHLLQSRRDRQPG